MNQISALFLFLILAVQTASCEMALSHVGGLVQSDPSIQERSENALVGMGKNAIPVLLKNLSREGLREDEHQAFLAVVERIGKQAIDPLIEELGRNETGYAARVALESLGDKAIPRLWPVVSELGPGAANASIVLAKNNRTGELIKILIPMLEDKTKRIQALAVVSSMGENAKGVVPTLTKLLDEKEAGIQSLVLSILMVIGSDASPALPKISRLLDVGDDGMKVQAAVTMLYISPESVRARAILQRHATGTGSPNKKLAAANLKSFGVIRKLKLSSNRRISKPDSDAVGRESLQKAGVLNRTNVLLARGSAYHASGRWKEAEKLFLDALDVMQKALPKGHAYLMAPLGALGQIAYEQGRLISSVKYLERNWGIWESCADCLESHVNSQMIYGLALASSGSVSEAKGVYQKILAWASSQYGVSSINTVGPLLYLAMLEQGNRETDSARKRLDEAIEWERSAPLKEKMEAKPAIDATRGYFELTQAGFTIEKGIASAQYGESEKLLKKLIELVALKSGSRSSEVVQAKQSLAALYLLQSKDSLCEKVLDDAQNIQKTLPNPSVLLVLSDIRLETGLAIYRSQYPRAKRLALNVLQVGKEHLPPGDINLSEANSVLSSIEWFRGDFKAAAVLAEKAWRDMKPFNEETELAKVGHEYGLSICYEAQGKLKEAEQLLKNSFQTIMRLRGENFIGVQQNLVSLGRIHAKQGKVPQGEGEIRRAIAWYEKVFADGHWWQADALSSLADLLIQEKRFAEALPLLQKAEDIQKRLLVPNHFDRGTTHQLYGTLYQKEGDKSKARKHFLRAQAIWNLVLDSEAPRLKEIAKKVQEVSDEK